MPALLAASLFPPIALMFLPIVVYFKSSHVATVKNINIADEREKSANLPVPSGIRNKIIFPNAIMELGGFEITVLFVASLQDDFISANG